MPTLFRLERFRSVFFISSFPHSFICFWISFIKGYYVSPEVIRLISNSHLSSMTPDIDTLTPPCCLSSLAVPLLGHQLWRGIDGSAAPRVQSPSDQRFWQRSTWENVLFSPLLCSWPRILVSAPMGLELVPQLGLLLLLPVPASAGGEASTLHILSIECPPRGKSGQ